MKINKYISTNFISVLGYISIFVMFYGFVLQDNIFFSNTKYLTLPNITEILVGIQILSILFFILFWVENLYRKKHPTKLHKVNIKNNILRTIYLFIFYIGFCTTLLSLLGTIFIYIFV